MTKSYEEAKAQVDRIRAYSDRAFLRLKSQKDRDPFARIRRASALHRRAKAIAQTLREIA
jgi:hypothetical protein